MLEGISAEEGHLGAFSVDLDALTCTEAALTPYDLKAPQKH